MMNAVAYCRLKHTVVPGKQYVSIRRTDLQMSLEILFRDHSKSNQDSPARHPCPFMQNPGVILLCIRSRQRLSLTTCLTIELQEPVTPGPIVPLQAMASTLSTLHSFYLLNCCWLIGGCWLGRCGIWYL